PIVPERTVSAQVGEPSRVRAGRPRYREAGSRGARRAASVGVAAMPDVPRRSGRGSRSDDRCARPRGAHRPAAPAPPRHRLMAVIFPDAGRVLSAAAYQTLSTLPALRGLGETDRERVAALFREEVVPKGTIVFREGDAATSLYIIASGQVR